MTVVAHPPPDKDGAARVAVFGGVPLVFGLEWQPVARPTDPGPELRQAREAGFRLAARLPDGSLLGLSRRIDGGRRAYSAVALLIARFAQQGAEACLIDVGDRVALVGLMDRRPVPGFDRLLPDLEAALALLDEFREMHPGQPVRVASYLPGRDGVGEALSPEPLFDQPDPDTRLRPLPREHRWTAWIAATLAAVLVAAAAGVAWTLRERASDREAAERARVAADAVTTAAQRQRDDRVARALAAAGRPGGATLARWRRAIAELPVSRSGWTLQQVVCARVDGCVATWSRHHGTLAQLDRAIAAAARAAEPASPPPTATALAIERQGGADRLSASMPAPVPDTAAAHVAGPSETLRQDALPSLRHAVLDWGSRLQDLMLVGRGEAVLDAGTSIDEGPGASSGTSPVPDVLRLSWRLKDGLWSLPLIEPPPYVVVESLTLSLGASQITYEVSGSLYAHGPRP